MAKAVIADNPRASGQYRFFLAPGVQHCRGGPGADDLPLLDALESWDSSGKAPDRLVATKADHSLTRPHCAWPQVAHYKGSGEANDPASWQCVKRS